MTPEETNVKESRILFKIRTDGERVIVTEPDGEPLAEVRLATGTDESGLLQSAMHEALDEALDAIDDAGASLAFGVGQQVRHAHWPAEPFYVHGLEVRRNAATNRWGWFAHIKDKRGQMPAWVPVHFLTPLDKCPTCGSREPGVRPNVAQTCGNPCPDDWHDRAS